MALAMLTSPVMWMNLLMKGVWEAVVIDGTLKVMAAAQISLLLHVVRGVKDRNVDDGGVKRPSGRGCVRSKGCVYMGPRGRAYAHGLEGGCVYVSSLQDRGHWVAGRHEFEQTSEGGGGGAG